ncbi:uncharacterized protein LOC144009123 isoform X2 [Festucalex cinctus]
MGTELSRGAPGQHSPGHPSKKGSGAPAAICKATTIMEYCLHISCCPSTFTSTEDKSATCCEKAVWDTDGSALQPCNWKAAFPQDGGGVGRTRSPTDSRLEDMWTLRSHQAAFGQVKS